MESTSPKKSGRSFKDMVVIGGRPLLIADGYVEVPIPPSASAGVKLSSRKCELPPGVHVLAVALDGDLVACLFSKAKKRAFVQFFFKGVEVADALNVISPSQDANVCFPWFPSFFFSSPFSKSPAHQQTFIAGFCVSTSTQR